MAETYSLGVQGLVAPAAPFVPTPVTVGDSTAGVPGIQARSMQLGTQVLCKNPDGSQSYYTIDASRSLPGGPLVMQRVGP